MIQVADNFNYRGKKPNFDRDSFDTLQDMKNYSENSLDDGHISYCKETNKHYKFNSNNQSDPTTGKWVEQHEAVPADEEDITEQNGIVLWETSNVLINNLEIVAQSNPIVGIIIEGGIKKMIASNVKFTSTNSDGNAVLCSVTEGADVTFNDTVFNVLDFSKLLIATMLDTESNISSVKLHNVTLYNNKFKSFDTFFSTIGNRVYLTGQITIQIPEDNSYGKFNSFNIGEEFIIPITIHYNKTSTATSDILYNFNNLLLTKADWYSEEDDIEIKGNLIGSKSQSIVIGKSKTGWNSKKLNVTIFDNTNCYISFVPKTTDTHAEIKLFIYARPFLNKSNTSTGNATVKTINIRSYGDTQHRPIIDRCNIGTMYFDTTLGKPIFNKNNSQWVDATGATV